MLNEKATLPVENETGSDIEGVVVEEGNVPTAETIEQEEGGDDDSDDEDPE